MRDETAGWQGDAGGRVHDRDLERVARGERRQEAREPRREHRLARPGRAHHQEVMRARGRDLDRKATEFVPPHIAEVGPGRGARRRWPHRRVRPRLLPAQHPHELAERRRDPHLTAVCDTRFDRTVGRHDEPTTRHHRGEGHHAGHTAKAAVEPELGEERETADYGGLELAVGCEHADRDRQIEPRATLRRPDGARLTVIRFRGHPRPLDMTALRTLSRDSRQAASGNPTMAKPGSPLDTWTSTLTARPSTPRRVAAGTVASTVTSLVCDMRTPQLHLRMTRGRQRGGQWGPYEGGGTFPEQEVSRGSTTLEWANRPISSDGPQDLARRADRHSVQAGADSSRGLGGRRPVTRKLIALVTGAVLVLSLTACMSTEESSVFNRINDERAKVASRR